MIRRNIKLWTKTDFDKLKEEILTKEELKLRHDLRYACFRIQKEINEGVECPQEMKDLVKSIEDMEGFEGWQNFAVTWDISHPDPITVVQRMWSIEQEHEQMLERVVRVLPPAPKAKE